MKKFFQLFFAIGLLCLSSCGEIESSNNKSKNPHSNNPWTSNVDNSSNNSQDSQPVTPPDDRFDFKDIGTLLASVNGATAFGIKRPAKKGSQNLLKKEEDTKVQTQNLWVKTTTIYDSSEPSVNEDGTINVTFLKTVTTEQEDEVTVVKTIRLEPSKYEIKEVEKRAGGIVVETEENREFRVLSNEAVLLSWTSGTETTIEIDEGEEDLKKYAFLEFASNEEYEIQTRLINVDYTFNSLEGDKYSLKPSDSVSYLFNDVMDNQEGDSNLEEGLITFSGLIEGVDYTLKQVGIRYTETIEQSEVNGVVDKLFATNQFTLVSFVPSGLSERPADNELKFDDFGVPDYDKTWYFSNETRQSFVISNETGKVYKIEGFTIKEIKNNLFYKENDSIPYDMKINENNELVFYALFNNPSVKVKRAHKDKYGHCFVLNDKFDTYDSTKDVTYYLMDSSHNEHFYLTSKKETMVISQYTSSVWNGWNNYEDEEEIPISIPKIIDSSGNRRNISIFESFSIPFASNVESSGSSITEFQGMPKKVTNGCVLYHNTLGQFLYRFYYNRWNFMCFDFIDNKIYQLTFPDQMILNLKFIGEHDIVLIFASDIVYAVYNFWATIIRECIKSDTSLKVEVRSPSYFNDKYRMEIIFENCGMDWDNPYKIAVIGLDGTTYYDMKYVEKDGQPHIEVIEGDAIGGEEKTIVLQPLN